MRTAAARERLIVAAMQLFHAKGYEATSVDDILSAADVHSGSLYYAFAGKEDLLLAVLDAYLDGLWPIVMAPAFARAGDPIDRIFEVLADYRARVLHSAFTYNCPIGSLALEVGHRLPAARDKIAANLAGWRAAIRQCLNEAADRLPADVDRAGLATFVLTVMEGGVLQARAEHDIGPYDASVAQLRRYIDSICSPRAAPGRTKGRKRGSAQAR
jgi:TetR/AcrR family transcriptional regulator, transcriptional repressor for nem operon